MGADRMSHRLHAMRPVVVALAATLAVAARLDAEVLVRWDQPQVPPRQSLGISTLVIPAANRDAVRDALREGYQLYLELDAANAAAFTAPARGVSGLIVRGRPAPAQVQRLERLMAPRGGRVIVPEEGGKWPHIRTNWVTMNNGVLQVTSRSAQPWLENNAALLRLGSGAAGTSARGAAPPLLAYPWTPVTLSDADAGPAVHNYLVAIAEAGSFGGDLLLPLHEQLQKGLLLARPDARADWTTIRRHIDFYAWPLAGRYRPLAGIGVIVREPMASFQMLHLLLRHNLPFEVIAPEALPDRDLAAFDLLIVVDAPSGRGMEAVTAFESRGAQVVALPAPPADPNAFALDIRRRLGRAHRPVDIWNGITVLAAPYVAPDGGVLLTALNYAAEPLPVQVRLRGTFSTVQYESPDEPAALLPHQHRDGYTEFVLPALRTGGRVFLSGPTVSQ